MKRKDFISLENRLLPSFPGFKIKGTMMYMSALGHTLRAFDFDASGWNKRHFYINAFFMPLCVPMKQVHFTFGHRVRREGWSIDEENLVTILVAELQKEVPFLNSIHSPKDVANQLWTAVDGTNHNCYEALAYSLALASEYDAAIDVIDALGKLPMHQDWEHAIVQRSKLIKSKLLENSSFALEQLALWENKTIRNLGLD